MFDRVPLWPQKKLSLFLMISLLSLNLACGLTQGLLGNEPATPALELGRGSQKDDPAEAARIDESTPEDEETAAPAESEASPTPDNETSPDSSPTETPAAEAESAQPSGALAENQFFILPGGKPPTMDPHLSGDAT